MKKIRYFLMIVFGVIFGYYGCEIFNAHQNTPAIKTRFLESSKIKLHVEDLSQRQLEIFIKVQDPNFWQHNGVEFSIPGSGWTTITQSIAKWFYFNPFKQGIQKIKQTLLARFVLNSQLTKQEQLLIFLNYIWFEKDVTGFSNAAEFYFNKKISELTEDEFLALLAMPVNPRKYNLRLNPAVNQDRVKKIKKMLNGEYVPKDLFDIYYDREE